MHPGTISAREELQVSWGAVSKHSSFASFHQCENPPPSPNNSLVTSHSGWMPCMSSLLGNSCAIHRGGLWASLFSKPQEREGGNKNKSDHFSHWPCIGSSVSPHHTRAGMRANTRYYSAAWGELAQITKQGKECRLSPPHSGSCRTDFSKGNMFQVCIPNSLSRWMYPIKPK